MSLYINVGTDGRGRGRGRSRSGKVSLKQFGYQHVESLSLDGRRRSLLEAAHATDGVEAVVEILIFCERVNRTRNPTAAAIFREDRLWLERNKPAINQHIFQQNGRVETAASSSSSDDEERDASTRRSQTRGQR
jgi:hypothetical protein